MKKSALFILPLTLFLLTACQPLATVPVDLTEAQRLELEQQVIEYEAELKQVKQELKEIENQTAESTPPVPQTEEEKTTPPPTENNNNEPENSAPEALKVADEDSRQGVENEQEKTGEDKKGAAVNTQKPSSEQTAEALEPEPEFVLPPNEKEFALTVRLANAYQQLGQVGQAIKLYEDYLAEDKESYAVFNNLGRLHEQLGQYEQAIAYYQRLIDEYGDKDYLRDVAKAYLAAKNIEKAELNYNEWKTHSKDTDAGFERQLNQLKQEQTQ